MEYLTLDRRPELHDPVAVIAFAGWNDASSAATAAARFLVRRLGARRFANVDPEPFFDFKENRPNVRIAGRGQRELGWPANDFFYARNPSGPHDLVVLIGTEPNLRWKTFTRIPVDLFRDLRVGLTISVGALMADVPHTRQVRVTGSAIDPEVAARLELTTSRYEGPTGILGVLHDQFRQEGMAAASLWANVPHYITTAQNPPATVALLQRLESLIGVSLDYAELTAAGERFVQEVDTALAANPEVVDYVHRLEAAVDAGATDGDGEPGGTLPQPEQLVTDIEAFLRRQREDE